MMQLLAIALGGSLGSMVRFLVSISGKLVMATQPVTVARIYLREGEHLLDKIVKFLHDEEKVSGITVLQGIAGFGPDGKIHTAHLVDLSLDLPLVVEFYDVPERVVTVIERLEARMDLPHVVTWPGFSHTPNT